MSSLKPMKVLHSITSSCKSFIKLWQLQSNKNCKMSSVCQNSSNSNTSEWMTIGDLKVFPWSISGIETSIVVKNPTDGFSCCFDMGHATRESVKCDTVLISHGHMDHISAVPQHIQKREIMGAKPATYYLSEHLVTPLTDICKQFYKMNEKGCLDTPSICGVKSGDRIPLNKGYYAIPFPTVHMVESQGYILYRRRKSLKTELQGLSSQEIGARVKAGEDVHVVTETPEIAFTGDTTFEVFTDAIYKPPADLFKVKLLIVEATYIDGENGSKGDKVQAARQWGHIHLSEIYENASMFKHVENILLIHFSDKYSIRYIQEKVYENIREELRNKVHVATLAKGNYI